MANRLDKYADQLVEKFKKDARLKVARSKLASPLEILEMLAGYLPATNIGSHGFYEEGDPGTIIEANYGDDTKAQKVRDTLIIGIQRGDLIPVENLGVASFVPAEVIGYVIHEGCGVPAFLAKYGRKWRNPEPQARPQVTEGNAPAAPAAFLNVPVDSASEVDGTATATGQVWNAPKDGGECNDTSRARCTNGKHVSKYSAIPETFNPERAELHFTDGTHVRIKCDGWETELSYETIGGWFINRSTKKPSPQWRALAMFGCVEYGIVTEEYLPKKKLRRNTLEQWISRSNTTLAEFLGLPPGTKCICKGTRRVSEHDHEEYYRRLSSLFEFEKDNKGRSRITSSAVPLGSSLDIEGWYCIFSVTMSQKAVEELL